MITGIETQSVTIPRLGLGTFRMPGAAAQPAVESALELGYRHIDTAAMYDNEAAVGVAVANSGIKRDDLFITTKAWHDHLDPMALPRALRASLGKLGLNYVDLYMVHWPAKDMNMEATLDALTHLKEQGLTRAIGVCNFNMPMMKKAVEQIKAPIAALQVEYHPFLSQQAMLSYVRAHGIALTAYAPLAQGRAAADKTLAEIGRKHNATAAHVAIAWLLGQEGVVTIPKASRSESQSANLNAFAVELDAEDRALIDSLPKDQRYVNPPFAPDWSAI